MNQINILTTPRADIEAAFELLEGGRSMLQPSPQGSPESWCSVYAEFADARLELVEDMKHALAEASARGDESNVEYYKEELKGYETGRNGGFCCTIYGDGGWNRYYVRANGDIEFSTFHQRDESKWWDAKELGFRVCALEEDGILARSDQQLERLARDQSKNTMA